MEEISAKDTSRIASCKTGEAFEAIVVSATKDILDSNGISAAIEYEEGSHKFPDIVIDFGDGSRYGIEVKSSSSASAKNWKINGNSVLGSTKEAVLDTYIIFGKTNPKCQAFRYKRYEDAVADVRVTHSPRYYIDLDVEPQKTFFTQSGLSYRMLSESDDPISLVTEFFRNQGQKAWWLSDNAPAVVRMFSDLTLEERSELIGYCFAHFPEVFSFTPSKYKRSALWLVMNRSIVSTSLRDSFSAGGRVDISIGKTSYKNVPKIFKTLHEKGSYVISALNEASADDLRNDWGYLNPVSEDLDAKVVAWVETTAQQCSLIPYSRQLLSEIMGAIYR